ncbi:hypothetical protein SY26_18605 [Paracoccus sp. 228]|nr:hypothetical protein SY26_18605 [Paracoccus sp. 228]
MQETQFSCPPYVQPAFGMKVRNMPQTVTKCMLLQCLNGMKQGFDRPGAAKAATASETRELNEEIASVLRARLGDDRTVSRR